MQGRAEGRPALAALATRQASVGVCSPTAACRPALLDPGAFDWLAQLLRSCHGLPGLSSLAAPARQLLVRPHDGTCIAVSDLPILYTLWALHLRHLNRQPPQCHLLQPSPAILYRQLLSSSSWWHASHPHWTTQAANCTESIAVSAEHLPALSLG